MWWSAAFKPVLCMKRLQVLPGGPLLQRWRLQTRPAAGVYTGKIVTKCIHLMFIAVRDDACDGLWMSTRLKGLKNPAYSRSNGGWENWPRKSWVFVTLFPTVQSESARNGFLLRKELLYDRDRVSKKIACMAFGKSIVDREQPEMESHTNLSHSRHGKFFLSKQVKSDWNGLNYL